MCVRVRRNWLVGFIFAKFVFVPKFCLGHQIEKILMEMSCSMRVEWQLFAVFSVR